MESKTLEYKWNPNYRQGWCVCGPTVVSADVSERTLPTEPISWSRSDAILGFSIGGKLVICWFHFCFCQCHLWYGSAGGTNVVQLFKFQRNTSLGFFNISNSEDRQFWLFETKIRMKDSRILVISKKKHLEELVIFMKELIKTQQFFWPVFFLFFFFQF